MASETADTQRERAADFDRKVERMYTAGVSGAEYDELEHLKEQYVDGELTEAEFEARLEDLDLLEVSRENGETGVRRNMVWGASVGAALAFAIGAFAALYSGTIFLATVLFIMALVVFVAPLELQD